MAPQTETRQPLLTVTEDTLLNEAMECPTARPRDPPPPAHERNVALRE